MGLGSTRELLRTLTNNPFIAEACGFEWPNVQHEATFSRFFARLSKQPMLARLKDVSRSMVRRGYADLPAFGKRVALDASTLKAWSNGGKNPKADGDAGWSVKKNTHGKNEYVFGYKLHLLVDCESEMPIAANISAGNVHDVTRASNALSEARFTDRKHFYPDFLLADAGYSSRKFRELVKRQYWAAPIVDPNKGHKRAVAETPKTPEWKALYGQRQAVERVFSRLKGQRR